MEKMIWSTLMHLSPNMWGDPGAVEKRSVWHPMLDISEDVWKNSIDFAAAQGINMVIVDVGDAIVYDRHPELAIPGSWSKEKLKVELDRIRSLGMTPIPKLNFSACHDAWLKDYSRMVSTPKYYEVCKDCVEEVFELFDKPAYFHLGFDEETAAHQQRMAYVVIRQGDLWWHDAYFFFELCEKLGTRPWVWSDYMWNHTEEYLEKMPKSVLQSNWYYGHFDEGPDGKYTSYHAECYRILEEAGFDQVLTCSSFSGSRFNDRETVRCGKEDVSPEHLKGFMCAHWFQTFEIHRYAIMSDLWRFRLAREEFFPEG